MKTPHLTALLKDAVKPREFWLPLTTLIVNSDADRPNGTKVTESSYCERLEQALERALSQIGKTYPGTYGLEITAANKEAQADIARILKGAK